jgi:proton-translocating NAD(P)+ transhydrogenase subunit alpha
MEGKSSRLILNSEKNTMNLDQIIEKAKQLALNLSSLTEQSQELIELAQSTAKQAATTSAGGMSPFMMGLTVFILACFVGYYVVWKVTPALHSPLMSITNAISSVIIVGALLAAGLTGLNMAKILGFIAVILASVNIFGGFMVTHRMLGMFMKKNK